MTDRDPVAWLDRHQRLAKFVLLPAATIGCWAAMLLVTSQMWKGYLLFGVVLTTSLVLMVALVRPCEHFVRWFASLATSGRIVRSMVAVRDVLISHGLWKRNASKGKHKWDYMSWSNPVNVHTLQVKLAAE